MVEQKIYDGLKWCIMRLFLGLFLIAGGISYAQDPNDMSGNRQTEAGNPAVECTNCPPGETSQLARDTLRILDEDRTCPESVKQIRLLMASTYGSCDAMNVRLTEDKMLERVRAIQNGQGNRIENIENRACKYGDGDNCTDISSEARYQNAIRNHPYNSIVPKCEPQPKCNIAGEERPCPGFFFLGNGYPDRGPYSGGRTIDPASNSFLNRDIQGNEFIGWNCSEYVATAMRFAGLNMKSCGEDKWSWWNVQRMSAVADKEENCSCMDVVDLSDPDEQIKPGDILLYGGHAMMIEASDPEFMGKLTNPTLQTTECSRNKEACEREIKTKCSEDNIRPNDLKFSINHASDSFGGIGPSSMSYGDYEGVRGYSAGNWRAMETFQVVKGRVRDLFDQTGEFQDISSDQRAVSRVRSAYSMWLEGKMETSVFFEHFLQQHTQRLGLSYTDREALENIDHTIRAMAIVRKHSPSSDAEKQSQQRKLIAYSMWLRGTMEGDVFKSAFLGEQYSRVGATWGGVRKHLSYLCKSRLCREHNVNTRDCAEATDLANVEQSDENNRFFKVIRHNSEKDGCVDPNPPKLKNPCGDTCNEDATKGCLFSSS